MADLIKMNKKGNKGRISVDMDLVTNYLTDPDSTHEATKIEFHDGTSIIVADTVSQIEVLVKWKAEGQIDEKGNNVKNKK
jgi:hypothetical protein